MSRPCYVLFAGVNGAGKSTLYHTGLWKMNGIPACAQRVNPDEILRDQHGSWASSADQLKAGKAALRQITGHFAHGRSFNQETALTGHRSLAWAKEAHEREYQVVLFYVGVADPSIAIERIRHRVQTGGHDIDERSVRRRYRASLANLSTALDWCGEVHVFDNTIAFKRIAVWGNGVLAWWGASNAVGAWLPEAIADETIWRA